MPYPHHPQHQHHQKSYSPSELRRVMTPNGHDDNSNGSSSGRMTDFNSAVTSREISLDRCDLPNIQRGDRVDQSSSPDSQSALFPMVSTPTSLMASLGESPPDVTSKASSHGHLSLPGPTLSLSGPSGEAQFVSVGPSEEVDMMPLDLSFPRPQGTEASLRQTYTPDHLNQSVGGSMKPGSSAPGYSRSHRLSPYHLFSLGLARSPSTTCLPVSRSPHSRSSSPFYQLHRQTPSPYYSYLAPPHGNSYYNPAENSAFQVLSTTNHVLNGLSAASGVFRPYEDHTPPAATPPPADGEGSNKEPEENEEPTYYDLDSAAQKYATSTGSGTHFKNDASGLSSSYNHQFHGVTSLDASQYHDSNASPNASSANVRDESMMAFSSSYTSTSSAPFSSSPSLSTCTSAPSSSTPPALITPLPFISQEVSEQAHCDLTHPSVRGSGHAFLPYPNSDEAIEKSNNQASGGHSPPVTTGNPHVSSQDMQHYRQQQQDPDSSSSLSTYGSSPSSSESPNGQSSNSSLSPTSNFRLQDSSESGLQQYPECDGFVTSSGTITSNKENLRESQFRRQSFFRAPDKDFMEQTCQILAEKDRNEGANRMSLLDFWISKVRIAAAQSRKSNICQNLQSNSKIKIRMVELMELQVEQSLRCDWR